jgi:hypothetical protein
MDENGKPSPASTTPPAKQAWERPTEQWATWRLLAAEEDEWSRARPRRRLCRLAEASIS